MNVFFKKFGPDKGTNGVQNMSYKTTIFEQNYY